jgi:hypothetical protein
MSSSSSSSGRSGREAAALFCEMRLVREGMAWWMSHKPEVSWSEDCCSGSVDAQMCVSV